ncbi:hypothetical protein [Streptomyces sp. B1I3]|uniref:hypothetical protein n=1 Tax=Streptomyces sp. B1I3 TaxID=3042264 RepID=UPI0027802BBE|nr:hypothetical protein [Streptomyces sp. B1I3]MDQ0792056.1 hypothetical protein [Streptomyces sp. B1I3]
MTRPEVTVTSELLNVLPEAPVEAREIAEPLLLRGLGLIDRPRDLKAERDYADSVDAGYVALPAGCSIPQPTPQPIPTPTADELNSIWAELAPNPMDGFTRLLAAIRTDQTGGVHV